MEQGGQLPDRFIDSLAIAPKNLPLTVGAARVESGGPRGAIARVNNGQQHAIRV